MLYHILFSCKHNCVFKGDRELSRVPEPTLNCLENKNKTRILKEFFDERIRPSILKLLCELVRKGSKKVVKLNTKKVRLNQTTKHKKEVHIFVELFCEGISKNSNY